jgi:hypothetical protein
VTTCPSLSSRSMSCGIDDGLEDDRFEDGYGYVIIMIIVFTLPLTSINILLFYTCYSL